MTAKVDLHIFPPLREINFFRQKFRLNDLQLKDEKILKLCLGGLKYFFLGSQITINMSLELKCFSKNLTPLKETYLGGTWDILVIDKMSQGRTNARVMMCIKKDSVSCRE